jgi:hypothetical protein
MNTRSAHEHTLLAPAELMRNWRQKQPSNQSDTDWRVAREVGEIQLHGENNFGTVIVYIGFKMLYPVAHTKLFVLVSIGFPVSCHGANREPKDVTKFTPYP